MGIKYSKDPEALNELFPDRPDVRVSASYGVIGNMIDYIEYDKQNKTLMYKGDPDIELIMTAFIEDILERFSVVSDTIKDHKVKIKNFKRGKKETDYNTYSVLNFDIILKDDEKNKYTLRCEVENDHYRGITYGMNMTVAFNYSTYRIEMIYSPEWQ